MTSFQHKHYNANSAIHEDPKQIKKRTTYMSIGHGHATTFPHLSQNLKFSDGQGQI